MIDIVLPDEIRRLTGQNFRVIVFGFLSVQIVLAIAFVSFCNRIRPLPISANSQFSEQFFKGLRIHPKGFSGFFALFSLIVTLIVYSFLIINNANFSFPDQSHITAGAMVGELWMQINPGNGRFSPLLHQEYLLLSILSQESTFYYGAAVLFLFIIVLFLLAILSVESLAVRVSLIVSFIVSTSFAVPISTLICPEINILLALILFIFCAYHLEASRKPIGKNHMLPSVGMIFSSIYLVYLKEPFFLVFATYSVLKISVGFYEILRTRNEFSRKIIIKKLGRHSTEVAIFLICCVYGLVYLFYIFIQIDKRYGSDQGAGFLSTFFKSLLENPLAGVFFLMFLWRTFLWRKSRSNFHPVLDPLAGGMLLYYAALIILQMTVSYYYLPICFMALLIFSDSIKKSETTYLNTFTIGICLLIFVYNIPSTLLFFDRRENYMLSREVAVNELRKVFLPGSPAPKEILFLDRNAGYDTEQFIAFANFTKIGRDLQKINSPVEEKKTDMVPIRPILLPSNYSQKISVDAIEPELFASNNVQASGNYFLALPDFSGFNNFLKADVNSEHGHYYIRVPESFLRQTIVKKVLRETVDYRIFSASF